MLQDPSTQRKAFERIVKAYSEQLYWQIRRMVFSHEDANDLLQNTFIKAWTNLDYFRGGQAFHVALPHRLQRMPELPEQAARRKPAVHRRSRHSSATPLTGTNKLESDRRILRELCRAVDGQTSGKGSR